MAESPRKSLRRLLAGPEIVVAPGAYDALTARLVEQAGFPAVYLTGAGVSYTQLAVPDLGLVTLTEMADRAARIAEVVSVPVIADADTGYGNAINVQRLVRAYERAGVAAFHLEDQAMPKRCGHLRGKQVIPAAEMCGKIRAARDAARDPDLTIIARTDARAVEGLDAALDRARRYAEAGADVLFVEAPESLAELQRIPREVPRPAMANMVEGGRTPPLSARRLQELGFRLVIFPNAAARTAAKAVIGLLDELKRTGTTEGCLDRMLTWGELNTLLGIEAFLEDGRRYAADT
jgi:methylisocitrate lyase